MVRYNSPEDPINEKAEPFAFTGEEERTDPHLLDVDESYDSLHHTIGGGPTQAAPGNHKHKAKDLTDFVEEGGIVTDHGQLSGLADDDHLNYHNDSRHALIDHTGVPGVPTGQGSDHGQLIGIEDDDHVQYHNNARGDARYPLKTNGTGANGTWPINISGNADTVDNLHVHNTQTTQQSANQIVRTNVNGYTRLGYLASAQGAAEKNNYKPAYVWGNNGTDDYFRTYNSGQFANASHSHGFISIIHHNFGTINAGAEKSQSFSRTNNQYPIISVNHPSTYIFAVVSSLHHLGFTIEVRNSTQGTQHTNVTVIIALVSSG